MIPRLISTRPSRPTLPRHVLSAAALDDINEQIEEHLVQLREIIFLDEVENALVSVCAAAKEAGLMWNTLAAKEKLY